MPNNATLTIGAVAQSDSAAQMPDASPDISQVNPSDKSSADEASGSHTLLVLLVIAVVAVVGGSVALAVLLRRKKPITK